MHSIIKKKKWNHKSKKWILLLDRLAKKQLKNYNKLDIQEKEIIKKISKINKSNYEDLENLLRN